MTNHSLTATGRNQLAPAIKAILLAGLLTGLLDATAAMVQAYFWNDVTPDRVWKYVASGALGRPAFSGGAGIVVMGLLFHFIIAFAFTVTFFFLYPWIRPYAPHIVVTGMLWGIVVWAVMQFVVVPLSNVPPLPPFSFKRALPQMVIHLFCGGLPMALVIHRCYVKKTRVVQKSK